jgi:hypothetical protein
MRAELKSGNKIWPILSMALYTELERFPRLFACIESEFDIGSGPFTFSLFQDDQIYKDSLIASSIWYIREVQKTGQSHYQLALISDPECDLEVQPFAENDKHAEELLRNRIGHFTEWKAPELRKKKLEAFISRQETFEQLARRVAGYTNDVFTITPMTSSQWAFKWAPSLKILSNENPKTLSDADVTLLAKTSRVIEGELQRLTVPISFDSALLETSKKNRVRNISRPVQLGEVASTSVLLEMPLTEAEETLKCLESRWYALTRLEALQELWQGGALADKQGDVFFLGSLFLYEHDAADSRSANALKLMTTWLGCGQHQLQSVAHGWAAFALAAPLASTPKDKSLLRTLIGNSGLADIWSRLIESMGCGYRYLACAPSPQWGPTLAIVVNNPSGKGPVGLSADHQTYRTKIWVRLPGVAGAVEVDWAVPFACEGGSGDLILVPEENTLGYLLFQEGHGAPLFFAMTHYKDATVSAMLNPTAHKHGLITQGGLIVREAKTKTEVRAHELLTLKASSVKNFVG